ncbi:PML protein, partial [Penelope pileata]|nr:PML protein [Penelope pileata]
LEDEFQFVLCEGCRQESPNLKLLTCLHTLCLGCLSENKPVGQCPMCQAPIPQPDGNVDNVLFSSLQARLRVYRRIASGAPLLCDSCRDSGEYWCGECREFLCTKCFEAHQRYLKRENHEAKKVRDIRAGSPQDFLKVSKKTGSSPCPVPTHKNQTLSIYCKRCCKAMCCICALLDAPHTGQHCDVGTEARLRREELVAAGQELGRRRGGFEAGLQASLASLQEEFSSWARANTQQVDELLGVNACILQAQCRLNKHVASLSRGVQAMARSLSAIASAVGTTLQPQHPPPVGEDVALQLPAPPAERFPALIALRHLRHCSPSSSPCVFVLSGAAPAPAKENSLQVPLTSTPAKRKKDESTNTLPSPAKAIKVEKDNSEWSTPVVPQGPRCSPQPGTSSSAPTVAVTKEGCLLDGTADNSDGTYDSDSDILCLDSDEEDSTDDEFLDPSLLEDFGSMLDDSTSRDSPPLLCSQNTLDVRQGSVVFFDVKTLKNVFIQVVVVDKERIFSALLQSSSNANASNWEMGLTDLLGHLSTIHRPILATFGLWSLPLPTLLKTLMLMGKKEEFCSTVYGFLDVLPLIQQKVPQRDGCKLKVLANRFLSRDLKKCGAVENAEAMRDLCNILEINLETKPTQLLVPASLEAFMSLQPLLDEKLLSKPSAQTLASHLIDLAELWNCFLRDPHRGLQRMCAVVNAHRHATEKKVIRLSKIKAYFLRQQPAASSEALAPNSLPEAIKTEQN